MEVERERDGPTAHRSDWQYVLLLILLFGFIGAIGASYLKAIQFQGLTPQLHFMILLQGISTITTLLFIWATVHEGRNTRQDFLLESRRGREAQRDEYAKERVKERLREQLEFYSPLAGLVRNENYDLSFSDYDIDGDIENANLDYELHAEPGTKKKLREYYIDPPIERDARSKFLSEFRTIVLEEFADLRDAYLSLMRARTMVRKVD